MNGPGRKRFEVSLSRTRDSRGTLWRSGRRPDQDGLERVTLDWLPSLACLSGSSCTCCQDRRCCYTRTDRPPSDSPPRHSRSSPASLPTSRPPPCTPPTPVGSLRRLDSSVQLLGDTHRCPLLRQDPSRRPASAHRDSSSRVQAACSTRLWQQALRRRGTLGAQKVDFAPEHCRSGTAAVSPRHFPPEQATPNSSLFPLRPAERSCATHRHPSQARYRHYLPAPESTKPVRTNGLRLVLAQGCRRRRGPRAQQRKGAQRRHRPTTRRGREKAAARMQDPPPRCVALSSSLSLCRGHARRLTLGVPPSQVRASLARVRSSSR